jgi:hypothetical protein
MFGDWRWVDMSQYVRSWDSSTGMVTRLQAGQPRNTYIHIFHISQVQNTMDMKLVTSITQLRSDS